MATTARIAEQAARRTKSQAEAEAYLDAQAKSEGGSKALLGIAARAKALLGGFEWVGGGYGKVRA